VEGFIPTDAIESDTDTDTDSDTDADTDTDTDTDTATTPVRKPAWSWGATNTFDNADASFVGVSGGYDLLGAGDLDGDGYAEIAMGVETTTRSSRAARGLGARHAHQQLARASRASGFGLVAASRRRDRDGRGELAMPDQSLLLGVPDLSSTSELVADVVASEAHGLPYFTMSRVEDMDGDGTNEWMVISNSGHHNGEAHIFDADAISAAKGELAIPEDTMWTLYGSGAGPGYFYAAGDATGDGLSDIFSATPSWPELWLVEGGWNPPKGTPVADAALVTIYSLCGGVPSEPGMPGDLDDDGIAELAISTHDGCDDGLHIFHGGEDLVGDLALSDASTLVTEGVLGGMGDIDGDGWTDLGLWPEGIILGSGALPAALTADDVDVRGGFPEVAGFPSYLSSARHDDGTLADIDGDGLGDLFHGARYYDESDEYAGVMRIVLGRNKWPATVTEDMFDATFFFGSDDDINTVLVTNIDGTTTTTS
jgi:hypothetical protein